MKLKDYTIITSQDHKIVETEVNRHLQNGAVLVGSLLMSVKSISSPYDVKFSQAIAYPDSILFKQNNFNDSEDSDDKEIKNKIEQSWNKLTSNTIKIFQKPHLLSFDFVKPDGECVLTLKLSEIMHIGNAQSIIKENFMRLFQKPPYNEELIIALLGHWCFDVPYFPPNFSQGKYSQS